MRNLRIKKALENAFLVFILVISISSFASAATTYINTAGNNISIGNANQIYNDASNNRLGLGDINPAHKLSISGNISFTGGGKISTYNNSLQFQAGGVTTGSTGTSSIYFLRSNGSGAARLDTNVTTTSYGTFYIGRTSTLSADLAEYYPVGDSTIEAGDLVSLRQDVQDNTRGILYKSRIKDKNIIGIISTEPGYLIGSALENNNSRMLVLAGRTPVKVSTENGEIKIGDPLTSSSTPGVAMKAIGPAYIIGKALEDFIDGTSCGNFRCGRITAIAWTARESGLEALQNNQVKINLLNEKTSDIERRIAALEGKMKINN